MKLIKYNTNSYKNQINTLPFNRATSLRDSLVEKMKANGFIDPITLIKTDVIDGSMRIYNADGEHRALAAMHLGIPFYGVLSPKKFEDITEVIKFVADLNTTQNPWVIKQYVKSYASLNICEYKTLSRLSDISGYSPSTISIVDVSNFNKDAGRLKITDGKFIFTYKDVIEKAIDYVGKLSNMTRKIPSKEFMAIAELIKEKRFNEKRFTEMFLRNFEKFSNLEPRQNYKMFESWLKH